MGLAISLETAWTQVALVKAVKRLTCRAASRRDTLSPSIGYNAWIS